MNESEEMLRAALDHAPGGLRAHVLRVLNEALPLAERHAVDSEATTIAVLGHDLLRACSDTELLAIARDQGFALSGADGIAPILLHGPLAVAVLRERYGVTDSDVLGAAAWHTTAHPGMSVLQKVVFLADKIEPDKRRKSAAVQQVAELAPGDLDAAMLAYLNHHVTVAVDTGWPLHARTIAARNELLAPERERHRV